MYKRQKKKRRQKKQKFIFDSDNSNNKKDTNSNYATNTIETDLDNPNYNNYLDDESFNVQFMHTARNKWRNNKKELTLEEKHELLEIRDNLKIYKYSNVEKKQIQKLIYQYCYDKYDENDFKNAKIILFIGKTGDGKTTAINAFFNIIKGIKLEDKYRYILIKEPKKEKGQAESQTDGLHIYYLKDKDNNPIIIIDSQGFGDTRGKEYDELVFEAFEYAFKNVIDHINLICFIAKSNEARLDILIKYIFSCVTSLFSEDITSNFIFLNTFANRSTIKEGPEFVNSITTEIKFNEIIKKMDKKWWYAAESINILDNEEDRLTLYSFKQLNALYEEKLKNSKAKSIMKSYEIISNRNKIKSFIKNFIPKYKNLYIEKQKISEIDRKINIYSNKINDVIWKINNKRNEISYIYVPNVDNQISILESKRNIKIYDLDNQYTETTIRVLNYVGGERTYCKFCERNCHDPCDCIGSFISRCYIFPIFGNSCELCGHSKVYHELHSGYKYVDEIQKNKIDNYSKISEVRNNYWKERERIYNEYYRKKNQKVKEENELNNLNTEKNNLNYQKNNYIYKKDKLNEKIKNINIELTLIILELKKVSEKIKNIEMNTFHVEIENEYIDSLISRLDSIGGRNEEIMKLKVFIKYNNIFQEIQKISYDNLIQFGMEYYMETFNKLIKL